MIAADVKSRVDVSKVLRAKERATIVNMRHAAALVRLVAVRSIRRGKNPSAPGRPPKTRRGLMKRAIRFYLDRQRESALIGTDFQIVGRAGSAHERGGRYRKERFPKRPFMGPALSKVAPRLPKQWAGSIR